MTSDKLKIYQTLKNYDLLTHRLLEILGFERVDCDEVETFEEDEVKLIKELTSNYFENEMPIVRTNIAKLIEEVASDERREMRMDYLENKIKQVYVRLERFKKRVCYNRLNTFFFGDQLEKYENEYERLYKEYGALKTFKEKEEFKYSFEEVQRARNYPLEDLLDTQMINIGDGKKKTLCPFHQEKTPSFVIYADNSWHCFGCGQHGLNTINYLITKDNFTFPEAVRRLLGY
jgi:hypothetical protein